MADITAGQRLVRMLDAGLAANVEWDAGERVVLTLIEQCADRVEVLKTLLDAAMGTPEVTAPRVYELAGEIRQAETAIANENGRFVRNGRLLWHK